MKTTRTTEGQGGWRPPGAQQTLLSSQEHPTGQQQPLEGPLVGLSSPEHQLPWSFGIGKVEVIV